MKNRVSRREKLKALAERGSTPGERAAASHILRKMELQHPEVNQEKIELVYFFGCENQNGGHWVYNNLPRLCGQVKLNHWQIQLDPTIGWIRNFDASPEVLPGRVGQYGRVIISDQVQGACRVTEHEMGGGHWTCLAWWDRTGDIRHGSHSQIWALGSRTKEQLLQLGQKFFPHIMLRQTADIFEVNDPRVFYLGSGNPEKE